MTENTILHGDCLTLLPTLSANSAAMVLAFGELYRVLANNSFYGWPHADKFMSAYRSAGFRVVGHLLFPKRYASSSGFVRYQHEAAHLLGQGLPVQAR